MAFSSVGSRGTANAKAAGATLSLSPTSDMAAGALVAVFVAWDNNNAGTADPGPSSLQHSVVDSVGNIYTTVVSGQERGGAQSAGVHGSIHVCRLEVALTTADTLTARLNTGNNLVAKSVSVWEFGMGSGTRWCLAQHLAALTVASDPAALSLSGLPAGTEYLLLHVLAAEGPNSDAYTWDADYTQVTGDGTTGGAADTNVHVRGGFRIATLTADTVDVTSDTADRDYWQGFLALYEYEPDLTYPRRPLLDDFNRADETPLDNDTWDAATNPTGVAKWLAVNTNECASDGAGSTMHAQYWLRKPRGLRIEGYATLTALPTGADDGVYVGTHATDPGSGFNSNAVVWRVPSFGVGPDELFTGRMVAISGGDVLVPGDGIRSWVDMATGAGFGIRRTQREIESWVDLGSGYQWVAAYFRSLNAGDKLILGVRDVAARVDDFGGGPFTTVQLPFLGAGP